MHKHIHNTPIHSYNSNTSDLPLLSVVFPCYSRSFYVRSTSWLKRSLPFSSSISPTPLVVKTKQKHSIASAISCSRCEWIWDICVNIGYIYCIYIVIDIACVVYVQLQIYFSDRVYIRDFCCLIHNRIRTCKHACVQARTHLHARTHARTHTTTTCRPITCLDALMCGCIIKHAGFCM